MDYSTYKRAAEIFVMENQGSLDCLKTYNNIFEEKVYNHMLSLMLKGHNQNGNELKETMNTNKAYWKRFITEHRG